MEFAPAGEGADATDGGDVAPAAGEEGAAPEAPADAGADGGFVSTMRDGGGVEGAPGLQGSASMRHLGASLATTRTSCS